MNKIADKILLDWDKIMFKMYLRQPGFAYIACGSFTKHLERIQVIYIKNETYKKWIIQGLI